MNAEEAVLVSEYEPSKVNFLFRPVFAAFIGGMVVLGALRFSSVRMAVKRHEEHLMMEDAAPPNKTDEVLDETLISTRALVEELKKRLSNMDRSERQHILGQLKSLP